MLETAQRGSLISVETCFFLQTKVFVISVIVCLLIFVRLIPPHSFLNNCFLFLSFRKLLVQFLMVQVILFWIFWALGAIFNDENDFLKFVFSLVFFSFHLNHNHSISYRKCCEAQLCLYVKLLTEKRKRFCLSSDSFAQKSVCELSSTYFYSKK